MPDQNSYKTYEAYVENVRDYLKAEKELRRTINRFLKQNKSHSVKIHTKLYAVLYSTFAEALFMKMILTPYGFEQKHLDEILNQDSILEKWFKCVELAFIKFNKNKKGSEVPNKKKEIKAIIQTYIVDPSVIRNKIAHGQFTIALNRKNSKLNSDITNRIEELNIVTIQRWFTINMTLANIIEELIESPDKAHFENYYNDFQYLESYILKTKDWTIDSKMNTVCMKKLIKIIQQK